MAFKGNGMQNSLLERVEQVETLLGYEELAAMLNLTVQSLRHRVARKQIPHFKLGSTVRFDPVEIREWLNRGRVKVDG